MKTSNFLVGLLMVVNGCKSNVESPQLGELEPNPAPPPKPERERVEGPKMFEPVEMRKTAPIIFESQSMRILADSRAGDEFSGNVMVQFKPGGYGAREECLVIAKADELTLGRDEVILDGRGQYQKGISLLAEGERVRIPKEGAATLVKGASMKIPRIREEMPPSGG